MICLVYPYGYPEVHENETILSQNVKTQYYTII